MNGLQFALLGCVLLVALMTSLVAGRREYFRGYGGPTTHYVEHANTRYYKGLGHAVSYYPPYRPEGKKGGRRHGRRGHKGGDPIIVVVKGGHGHGGHSNQHEYGGYDGGYDVYGLY